MRPTLPYFRLGGAKKCVSLILASLPVRDDTDTGRYGATYFLIELNLRVVIPSPGMTWDVVISEGLREKLQVCEGCFLFSFSLALVKLVLVLKKLVG